VRPWNAESKNARRSSAQSGPSASDPLYFRPPMLIPTFRTSPFPFIELASETGYVPWDFLMRDPMGTLGLRPDLLTRLEPVSRGVARSSANRLDGDLPPRPPPPSTAALSTSPRHHGSGGARDRSAFLQPSLRYPPLPRVFHRHPGPHRRAPREEALHPCWPSTTTTWRSTWCDRSTDSTGAILERMAAANPRVRLVHIREMLRVAGKNQPPLELGGRKATGTYLLFINRPADIVMEPSALRGRWGVESDGPRSHCRGGRRSERRSLRFDMFIGRLSLFFSLYIKPWKVREPEAPESRRNRRLHLVRASRLRGWAGHQRSPCGPTRPKLASC